jgi:hypothetical protein
MNSLRFRLSLCKEWPLFSMGSTSFSEYPFFFFLMIHPWSGLISKMEHAETSPAIVKPYPLQILDTYTYHGFSGFSKKTHLWVFLLLHFTRYSSPSTLEFRRWHFRICRRMLCLFIIFVYLLLLKFCSPSLTSYRFCSLFVISVLSATCSCYPHSHSILHISTLQT